MHDFAARRVRPDNLVAARTKHGHLRKGFIRVTTPNDVHYFDLRKLARRHQAFRAWCAEAFDECSIDFGGKP